MIFLKVIYIREAENINGFVKKTIIDIKRFFNIIDRKDFEEKTIYYLPIVKDKKLSNYRIKKLSNKIIKLLEKDETSIVVVSRYLNSIVLLKNYLYSQNINILDGRFLFKCLIDKIIEKIFKIKNENQNFGEITLLVNDYTEINEEIIIYIAKNIKRLNIVTNHINKFKKLEEYLYDEYGIMLNISNSKRRSLLKSEIIINIDFPEELINKYRIYDESIIVNINDKIKIFSKRFNGKNYSYYKIKIPEKYKLEEFANEVIYESMIYNLRTFKEINEKIEDDKIQIEKFV